MSKQHHTISTLPLAEQARWADKHLCARVLTLFIMIFILSTSLCTTAHADTQRSRAQAVQIAKAQSGNGRVLSVKKRVNKNGVSIFAVKIIVNGRVKIYAIPEFAN